MNSTVIAHTSCPRCGSSDPRKGGRCHSMKCPCRRPEIGMSHICSHPFHLSSVIEKQMSASEGKTLLEQFRERNSGVLEAEDDQ